ncbi:MAG: hypothetical protein HN553_10770 [Opitutae bacterium]|nr:hypothetical protein [Opitutae bacterium]
MLLFLTILGRNLFSANQYWDRHDGSTGASTGVTASGDWDDSNWNSNADGSGSNGTWSNGNTAIFSAGSDATGISSITANLNNATLGGLTVEEGDITIEASGSGTLTLSANADFEVAEGSTLTITEPLLYDGKTLNKIGEGLLTINANNTPGVGGTTTITQGKIDLSSAVTNFTGNITGVGTTKSMLGGDGIVNSATFGNANGEIDFVSPGLGLSSSMTNNTSRQQLSAADDERSSGAEAVGSLTVTNLALNGGTIYDWEIADFSPGTNNGSAYDVLKYNSINFESGQKIGVNILAVQNSNGAAGRFNNFSNAGNNYSDGNGFHFLQSSSGSDPGGISGALQDAGDASSYFDLYTDSFDYYYGPGVGSWGVWYDGSGDFYLTYSAVPEPSTYIMISALFLIIGFNQSSRKTLHSLIASLRQKFSKNTNQPVPAELS